MLGADGCRQVLSAFPLVELGLHERAKVVDGPVLLHRLRGLPHGLCRIPGGDLVFFRSLQRGFDVAITDPRLSERMGLRREIECRQDSCLR